jgi:hypothetical protein
MNKKSTVIIVLVFIAFLAMGASYVNSVNAIIKSYGAVTPTGPFRPCNALNDKDNVYFTIYNTDTGQVWNENGSVFVDTDDASVVSGNYANIAITATDLRDQAEDGWMIAIPDAIKNADSNFECDIKFYDNASPVVGDTIEFGRHCFIKAVKIGATYTPRIYAYYDL